MSFVLYLIIKQKKSRSLLNMIKRPTIILIKPVEVEVEQAH